MGKKIDSSGKRQGASSEGRNIDHREIAQDALGSKSALSGSEALIDFMNKTKAIRVSVFQDTVNIDLLERPTSQQMGTNKKIS